MNQVQPRQVNLHGGSIPVNLKDPARDLSPIQRKIYNFLRRTPPKTEKEISIHPAFHDVSDVGRALRSLRAKNYARTISQREGPQKWTYKP